MKGWRSLTAASLAASEQEIQAMGEAEMLREASDDSDSEPSVIPNSSQTSDEPLLDLSHVSLQMLLKSSN